jgi:hypothetical protein
MNTRPDEEGRESRTRLPDPHPSPRVRLEVAALDGDDGGQPSLAPAEDVGRSLTVLIVAGDADLRHYVTECLRARRDLRSIEAATVGIAHLSAAQQALDLIVADERARDVIAILPECRAIVLVDDVPRDDTPDGGRVRFLARPFTARELMSVVSQSLD